MTDSASPLVLVVDDDAMNREVMEAFLSLDDYRVLLAHNAEQALQLIAQTPPHLIIMDVRMPDMDGFELCRRLKDDPATRPIPILLVTGLAANEVEPRAQEAGAEAFLTRPYDGTALLQTIQRLLKTT